MPIDDRELGLPVERVVLRRGRDVVVRSGERLGELGEQGRVLREVAAHLEDVGAVVEPDADHLAGARHDWRQVEVAQSVSLVPSACSATPRHPGWPRSAPTSARRRGAAARRPGRRRLPRRRSVPTAVPPSVAEGHEPHASSSWSAVEREPLDDGVVAEAEEVEAGVGGDAERGPRRHHDHVALLDRVLGAAEHEGAGAFEDLVDARTDLAPGAGDHLALQPVELCADRGHDVAAGGRVHVADGGVTRARRWPGSRPSRGPAGRRARGPCAPSGRRRSARTPCPAAADSGRSPGWHQSCSEREMSGRRLVGDPVAAELEEGGVGVVDEGDVQPVDPRHRLVGLVVVAVELPARGQQEVAASHRDRVAVDDGPHALALDDEAEGVLAVAVLGSDLVPAEVLDGRPQRGGRVGLTAQARVGQRDGATLSAAAHRDQVAGSLGQWQQGLPRHTCGTALRLRGQRHQVADLGPQRHQVLAVEVAVEAVDLLLLLGGRRWRHDCSGDEVLVVLGRGVRSWRRCRSRSSSSAPHCR